MESMTMVQKRMMDKIKDRSSLYIVGWACMTIAKYFMSRVSSWVKVDSNL